MLVDILRRELLLGSEGLPFGLVSAPSRFQELSFWRSSDFWFGQARLPNLPKRFKIILLLLVCSLIALFAGPSSALLMLPQEFTDWPGGGATFLHDRNGRHIVAKSALNRAFTLQRKHW